MKVKTFIEHYMGKQVRFNRKLVKREDQDGNGIYFQHWCNEGLDEDDADVGWVTGLRWLPRGTTVDYGWEDGGKQFRSSGKATPAALVVTYPTRNPVRVPLSAITVLAEPVEVHLVDEKARQWMRDEVGSWPRDSRGRFTRTTRIEIECEEHEL